MRYIFSLFFLLFLLVSLVSCSSTKKSGRTGDTTKTYQAYSAKYGVELLGTENLDLLKYADQWLGVPYKLGGTTKKGIDCSAFVSEVYRGAFNVSLSRSAKDMVKNVTKIKHSQRQYGDLLFFAVKQKQISHVGIYLGDNKFLHSSASKGVAVAVINEKYWKKYLVLTGRIPNIKTIHGKTKKEKIPIDYTQESTQSDSTPPKKTSRDTTKDTTKKANNKSDINYIYSEEF